MSFVREVVKIVSTLMYPTSVFILTDQTQVGMEREREKGRRENSVFQVFVL